MISSKTEKWDLHLIKSQDAKTPHLKRDTEAIKSASPSILRNWACIFFHISRCQNTHPEVAHLNISHETPNQSLQLENTRSLWKKLIESEKTTRITLPILETGTFILLYSKVPTGGLTNFNTIQTATIWSLKLGNIKSLRKKLIESEKNYKHIRKTLAIPRKSHPFYHMKKRRKATPTVRRTDNNKKSLNHPKNWKTVNNYENNQGYAARA